jgi:hypothetical protein
MVSGVSVQVSDFWPLDGSRNTDACLLGTTAACGKNLTPDTFIGEKEGWYKQPIFCKLILKDTI